MKKEWTHAEIAKDIEKNELCQDEAAWWLGLVRFDKPRRVGGRDFVGAIVQRDFRGRFSILRLCKTESELVREWEAIRRDGELVMGDGRDCPYWECCTEGLIDPDNPPEWDEP